MLTSSAMQGDPSLLDPDVPVLPPGEDELPSDDGEPMETNQHRMQMVLLIQSLKEAWAHRDDFFVAGNMFVYFSETQVTHNDFRGPDVFVVLGTTRRSRKSWVTWGEGGKLPDVVIELLSFRTRHVDRGDKMRIYSKIWRTPEYFLYDPGNQEFEGYRLDPTTLEYVPILPNENGDLECRVLGLGLGIRDGLFEDERRPWLRWLDTEGNLLPTSQERAEAERRRAQELEARVRELESKLNERR